jgi:hypothetical protein
MDELVRKDSYGEVSSPTATWSGWLQALQSCNERLGQYLAEGDWEKAQEEVTTRDHLLRESAPVLMRLKKAEQVRKDSCGEGEAVGDLERVKQVLLEVQETGRVFLEALNHRRQELDHRIKVVQQGRVTVNLYRPARPEASPRFLDREG